MSLKSIDHSEIFNGKFVNQSDFEAIFPLISSIQLENGKIPVSVASNQSYALDRKELVTYFTDLENYLKETDSIMPVFLSSNDHSVLVNYDKKKQKWIYVDTNFLSFGKKNYYLEVSSKELAGFLVLSFQCKASPYVVFNAIPASTSKENDASFFDTLASKHLNIPKQVVRYDADGVGLLYMACNHEQLDRVKELVRHPKIDINKTTVSGVTPLYIACQHGYVSVVEELLQQPNIEINKANQTGHTPLLIACQLGHADVVEKLLQHPGIRVNQKNNRGVTALFTASLMKHLDVVKKLVQQSEININEANEAGYTSLHIVDNIEIVKILLQHPKIKINEADKRGQTPLHIACLFGNVEIVRRLLQRPEIDIHKKDKQGNTPLSLTRYASEPEKRQINLYLNIKQMEFYGNDLLAHDVLIGKTAQELALKLRSQIDDLLDGKVPKQKSIKEFISEFKALLHSKDQEMKAHRAAWKPILANILVALTVLGFAALLIRSIKTISSSSSYTWKDCFFFNKTNREKQIEHIDKSLSNFSDALK